VVAYLLAGTKTIRSQARPALFVSPVADLAARARKAFGSAAVPEQYRTILSLRGLEAAIAGANPVVWLGALVALGFAVTRF
jgi:hypothetical protein